MNGLGGEVLCELVPWIFEHFFFFTEIFRIYKIDVLSSDSFRKHGN